MELKDVVGVGQAGLSAVLEEVAKVRADAEVEAADAEAAEIELAEADSEAGNPAAHALADVIGQVQHRAPDLLAAASAVVIPAARRRGTRRALVGVVALGAAAGAGYLLWRKRQQAMSDELSGVSPWAGTEEAGPESEEFMAGMADLDNPDVVDEQFAKEVDEVADELAEDLVAAVEVPGESHDEDVPPQPEEPFEPGMADLDSPDVVDEEFATQVDAEADQFAANLVDAVEIPGESHGESAAAQAEDFPVALDVPAEEVAAELDVPVEEIVETTGKPENA